MGAATPENKVKAGIKQVLNELAAWYFMPTMNGLGRAGIPDFICCINGRFVAIEAKAPGKKPTQWQSREIDAIRDAGGGLAFVIADPSELRALLEEEEVV